MRQRILAIVNPISGPRDVGHLVHEVRDALLRRGVHLEVALTEGPGSGERLARTAAERVDAVLVAGGDGTVCDVANGLVGAGVPLAILRTGTENLLAKVLKMPRRPDRLAATLLDGQPAPFDVGVINGRHFLAVTGVGFDAEVVERLANARTGHITHFSYFWPIWRTFWTHRFLHLLVEVDGRVAFEGHGFAIVGNIPRYSIGLRILREARPDDGLLDVCVFRCTSQVTLLAHAGRVLFRRHVGRPGVLYAQGRAVRITSKEGRVPIEVDGDVGGVLPAEWSVLPGAVSFLRERDESPDVRLQ